MGDPRTKLVRYRYTFVTATGLALESIRSHKLRSFLTLLGVIIGVASVVLVGAAIEGLGVYAEESTAKVFGSNTFLIAQVASAGTVEEFWQKVRRNKFIRYADYRYLEAATGDRILYSSYRQQSVDAQHGALKYENCAVLGVSAALPEIRELALVDGRFFTAEEDRTRQFVAVIGDDIRTALFPSETPVGKTVRISGFDFEVMGVLDRIGSSFGHGQDNVIYIPAAAFTRLYGTRQSFLIYGRARPGTGLSLEEALDVTRVALRARLHARLGQPDNFDNITPEGVRAFIDNVLGLISVVVVPVTCISLIVGGIVIMNIMLVSVTERTHEIGVRKSLGARTGDIKLQFLVEAVLMAAVGGAIGVLAGAGLAELLSRAFGISMRITATYVAVALIVSSAVGILSGWYPASRAARLDPVVALRAE